SEQFETVQYWYGTFFRDNVSGPRVSSAEICVSRRDHAANEASICRDIEKLDDGLGDRSPAVSASVCGQNQHKRFRNQWCFTCRIHRQPQAWNSKLADKPMGVF